MRRPNLAVDTNALTEPSTTYELTQSPRTSTYSTTSLDLKKIDSPNPVNEITPPPSLQSGPQPSIRLLFSLISRRRLLLLVLPAIVSSMIAGAIAPFMTYVIGQAFNSFAQFPLTPHPPKAAKDALLHGIGIAALELIGLAVGSLALSSLTSCLWIWTGERNVMALRKRVYNAVTRKDMVWFDTKMGAEGNVQSAEGDQGPLGAGGLMAKFTRYVIHYMYLYSCLILCRETDDVRMATSLACGMLIQYLTTCIACLILAFLRSWALTLVILSAVPVLVLIQAFSQAFAGPLLAAERSQTATAATLADRAIAAISTVKAFNASSHEQSSLDVVLDRVGTAAKRLNAIWGLTSGLAQFVMMAMFVQGFWFGSKLVKEGKVGAGDVMAVFWACLIATSNLQMCIPQFITLAKGKFAMVSLLTLVSDNDKFVPLRKIIPPKCSGEVSFQSVTFAYPSRPTMPVLHDVSLFLPAHETTFIVGGSGSGKSTIAQLLLGMYEPQSGSIQLDDQELGFLDGDWTRGEIAGVEQGCILFDMSVHDNVALGLAGGSNERVATREEVVEACRAALMHDFVRDLPDGYDTKLGTGGASLSGGQKQRLAIARAKLRNPTVLILGKCSLMAFVS